MKEVRRVDLVERRGPMLEMRRRAAAARRGVSATAVGVGAQEAEEDETMGAKRPEEVGAMEVEWCEKDESEEALEVMDELPTSEKGVREEEGTGGGGIEAEEGESREKKLAELTSETRGRGERREAAGLVRSAPRVDEERALRAIISAALAVAPC